MKLYLIRHAIAEDRIEWAKTGRPDDERPLLEKGRERMLKIAQKFKKMEPEINKFLQSPLTRSIETVDVLTEVYQEAQIETTELLAPGHSNKELLNFIMDHDLDSLALVGHEPYLGQFLSWLLFRQATDHFPMKKSGIAKVDLYDDGRCYLKWLLRPGNFI